MRQRFTFQGNDLVFDSSTDDIVLELIKSSKGCPIEHNPDIHFRKELGRGVSGRAWEIFVEGYGAKPYVAKVTSSLITKEEITKTASLNEIAESYLKLHGFPPAITIALNGGDPYKIINKGEKVCLATYIKPCSTRKEISFKRVDGNGTTLIPKGSCLCDDSSYSEYYIGLLCARLYKGISPFENATVNCVNFIDVFGFTNCVRTCDVRQYVFMEKIHGDVETMPIKGTKVYDSICIQLLFAIYIMQISYDIEHGDLHTKNMFIQYITPTTTYNSQNLYDADYFEYKIGENVYYVENHGVILKIGDFGMSVKYSDPVVGSEYILETGAPSQKTKQPTINNWYSPSYDVVFAVSSLNWFLDRNGVYDSLANHIYNHILSELGDHPVNFLNGRPLLDRLDELDKITSPQNLIPKIKALERARVKPKGVIARVGEIS